MCLDNMSVNGSLANHVDYRDHWFWIEDRDLKTKRVFAFTLADTSDKESLPLITIPAQ